jgi:hypothetical protein
VDRLYLVPSLTILVVGAVVLTLGASRPEVGARIYGGPTEGVTRLSWRVELVERSRGVVGRASSRPLRIEATLLDGRTQSWSGRLDEWGESNVTLDFGRTPVTGPVSVRVLGDGAPLGEGRVMLGVSSWREHARARGGWVKGRSRGGLVVEVAPAWGVLAVPFVTPLWIDVRDARGPVEGARLSLAPEGMMVVPSRARAERVTDGRGRAEVLVEPREHVIALGVKVEARDRRSGEFYSTLPVVAGALHASLGGHRLRVASSIPLDRAYYAIVTERMRGPGGALGLTPDGRGGSVGLVDLPELPREPWWAVVSTDADLDSPATVGWPLGEAPGTAAREPLAWSVPDRLLWDGLVTAERAESRRRGKIAALTAGFVSISALLSVLLVVQRARAARKELERHLGEQDPERARAVLPSRAGFVFAVAVAVLCVTLGFLLLALLGVLRVG